jgi:creatinine amidohydrolase/Fe(II)-dependent formamide hydrolase-like protein
MSARYLTEMLPAEIEAELKAGNDLAIIPTYSIEQHGPHLLLGTDGYGAQVLAEELSRLTGGFVTPAIPFSWMGCTNAFSGGVGVREEEFIRYLTAVVKGLWQSGFRRILIWNTHGGNFYAMRTFPTEMFREHGIPVMTIYGTGHAREADKLLGRAGGEAGFVAAACRMLGREDLVTKIEENNRKAIAEFGDRPRVQLDPPAARASRKLGNVGHDYSHEALHVQPGSGLDVDTCVEAMKLMAKHVAGLVEDFGAYVRSLEKGSTS